MSTEQKIILVDQDNVIADQLGHFHALLKRNYPEVYATYRGETTSYEIEEDFAPKHSALIKSLRNQEGFFRDLPIVAGAKEGLLALQNAGYLVRICTAPIWKFQYCVPEKLEWIERELGHDWAVLNTIIARDKTLIAGSILIDDKPEVTGESIPTWTQVLYDQPYNRESEKKRINWKDVDAMLTTINSIA